MTKPSTTSGFDSSRWRSEIKYSTVRDTNKLCVRIIAIRVDARCRVSVEFAAGRALSKPSSVRGSAQRPAVRGLYAQHGSVCFRAGHNGHFPSLGGVYGATSANRRGIAQSGSAPAWEQDVGVRISLPRPLFLRSTHWFMRLKWFVPVRYKAPVAQLRASPSKPRVKGSSPFGRAIPSRGLGAQQNRPVT